MLLKIGLVEILFLKFFNDVFLRRDRTFQMRQSNTILIVNGGKHIRCISIRGTSHSGSSAEFNLDIFCYLSKSRCSSETILSLQHARCSETLHRRAIRCALGILVKWSKCTFTRHCVSQPPTTRGRRGISNRAVSSSPNESNSVAGNATAVAS